MPGVLASLFGRAAAEPVKAIGNVIDGLFTSDEERLDKQALLARIAQQPQLATLEIARVQAAHRHWFVAGARPAVTWACALGLLFAFVLNPILAWLASINGQPIPAVPIPTDTMLELVLAVFGLGALRTAEKMTGRAQ